MRASDAVGLRWGEVDWETREINRLTQKRKKRVILPIHQELFFALEVERGREKPQPEDRILRNSETNGPLTRKGLYLGMLAIGRRAGTWTAPAPLSGHLCRRSLARGVSPYDVAKLLVDTVEKHCAPFVKELRDPARRLMESGEGGEKTDCTISAQQPAEKGRIQ